MSVTLARLRHASERYGASLVQAGQQDIECWTLVEFTVSMHVVGRLADTSEPSAYNVGGMFDSV